MGSSPGSYIGIRPACVISGSDKIKLQDIEVVKKTHKHSLFCTIARVYFILEIIYQIWKRV